MKIMIVNDQGEAAFTFDSATAEGVVVTAAHSGTTDIKDALAKATSFMTSDAGVISSIKADIRSAVTRIETELGAHPALTWAQTKLGNAIAHLEAYVAGNWTEPVSAPGVVVDQRGVIVAVPPSPTAGAPAADPTTATSTAAHPV